MPKHEYHQQLSSFRFRRYLGDGRGGVRYYSLEDTCGDVRALAKAAEALAKENNVDVSVTLSATRFNKQGWPLPPTREDLEHDVAATRHLLDVLRLAHIDISQIQGHSLGAYALDLGTEWCALTGDNLVRCHWRQPYVGLN